MKKAIVIIMTVLLLFGVVASIPPAQQGLTQAQAASFPGTTNVEYYDGYTKISDIGDASGGGTSSQGFAISSQYMYCAKIGSSSGVAIRRYNMATGKQAWLQFETSGSPSPWRTDFGHINDLEAYCVNGIDRLFVVTDDTVDGSYVVGELKVFNLSKLETDSSAEAENRFATACGSYKLMYGSKEVGASGFSVKSVSGNKVTFYSKSGLTIYTGTLDLSSSSGNVAVTKVCTLDRSKAYFDGTLEDLSDTDAWLNQGMGYYNGNLYLPLSSEETPNRSVILVYDLENGVDAQTLKCAPDPTLSFDLTSSENDKLFEIESCEIGDDGRLYFNTNSRQSNGTSSYAYVDNVCVVNDYIAEGYGDLDVYWEAITEEEGFDENRQSYSGKDITLDWYANQNGDLSKETDQENPHWTDDYIINVEGQGTLTIMLHPYPGFTTSSGNIYIDIVQLKVKGGAKVVFQMAPEWEGLTYTKSDGTTIPVNCFLYPEKTNTLLYVEEGSLVLNGLNDSKKLYLYNNNISEPIVDIQNLSSVRHDTYEFVAENAVFRASKGGAIRLRPNDQDAFILRQCDFKDISVDGNGGAVYLMEGTKDQVDGAVATGSAVVDVHEFLIEDCTFTNITSSGLGGAIALLGRVHDGTICGTTFDDCVSSGDHGGAIALCGDIASFTVTGGEIKNCTSSKNGGAIYAGTRVQDLTRSWSCYSRMGRLAIDGVKITDCSAGGDGGGISVATELDALELTGTTLKGCTATGIGGGLALDKGELPDTFPTSSVANWGDSTFAKACCGESYGTSGCYSYTDSNNEPVKVTRIHSVSISDGTTFESCSASKGGGLALGKYSYIESLMFKGETDVDTIAGCTATQEGSAIYIRDYAGSPSMTLDTVTIADCDFVKDENGSYVGTGNGGTIKTTKNTSVQLIMTDCTMRNNTSYANGGGLYWNASNTQATTPHATLTDCVFDGNVSQRNGGAIFAESGMTLTGCQIRGNTAILGGGIHVSSGGDVAVDGGDIVGNQAVGTPDASVTTGYHLKSTLQGVGGGVFVANGTASDRSTFTLTGAVYGNTADFAADDVFANGSYTSVDLPMADDMELTASGLTGAAWFEDYPAGDTSYDLGLMGGSAPNVRYDDLSASHVPVLAVDGALSANGEDKYVALTLGEHSYETTVTPPTCNTAGYTTYTCSTCGSSYTGDTVAATGHSYTSKVTAATCTTAGYTTYTCSTCGSSYTGDTVAAIGHSYTSVSTATCTEAGEIIYTCTVCGDSYSEAQEALGHSFHATRGFCTACGLISPDTTYYLLGTINGVTYTKEMVAADPDSAELAMLKFDQYGVLDITLTAPIEGMALCRYRDDGSVARYDCSSMDADTAAGDMTFWLSLVDSGLNVDMCVHQWDEGVTIQDATCIAEGATRYTCTGTTWDGHSCACTKTVTEPITGHSYTSKVTAATCTTAGYTTYTCSTCGHSYTGDTVAATGHSYTSEVTTAATCTSTGVKTYTCSECGNSYTETIAALGHSYTDGICGTCGEADPDYVAPVTQPTLTLNYPSLSFESEILYNVYFTAADIDDVVEMGLITFGSRLEDGTVADAVDILPNAQAYGTMYMAQTGGIAAKYMGDALYFKVYAKLSDGSYVYSSVAGYNAIAYANTIFKNSTSDEMKALCVAMLNYGAEAQKFFGHNVDSLMNAGLTAEQLALVDAYDETMVDAVVAADSAKTGAFVQNKAGFSALKPTVSFDGAFAINYYFTTAYEANNGMTMYYWTSADYAAADVLSTENATGTFAMTPTGAENEFWGEVGNIAAKELDQTIYVTAFYTARGTTYCTGVIAYHIGRYCEGIAANADSDMQALSAATATYGYYAKSYFALLAEQA